MPGQIRELPIAHEFSIDTQGADFDAEFFVWDTTNELEVQALVYSEAPLITLGLVRGKAKCKEVGPGMWMCSIHYGTYNPQQAIGREPPPAQTPTVNNPLGPEFSFDTAGGTEHIQMSLRTRSMATPAGTSTTKEDGSPDAIGAGPIDTAKAIGVSADRIEGTDRATRKFEWNWEQPLKEVPIGYLICLFHLSGTVNYAAPFHGFDRGEVLYLGASGRYSQANQWNITHRFAAKPNRRNVTVGISAAGTGGLSIPFIAGWDYVWFEYATRRVGTRMLQVPVRAFVEVVCETGDLGLIFGGPPALQAQLPAGIKLKNLSKFIQQIVGTPVPPFDGDPDI